MQKKAKENNQPYNEPSTFDLNNANDKKAFAHIQEVNANFASTKKLAEMLHKLHTQANKSPKMHAAELAPKFKKYSCTTSLNFRMNLVIGHHNLRFHKFHTPLLANLEIFPNTGLKI